MPTALFAYLLVPAFVALLPTANFTFGFLYLAGVPYFAYNIGMLLLLRQEAKRGAIDFASPYWLHSLATGFMATFAVLVFADLMRNIDAFADAMGTGGTAWYYAPFEGWNRWVLLYGFRFIFGIISVGLGYFFGKFLLKRFGQGALSIAFKFPIAAILGYVLIILAIGITD